MRVDDAEIVFNKRWNRWSEPEKREFIRALEPGDLTIALTVDWAYHNMDLLAPKTLEYFVGLLNRSRPQ